MTFRLKKIMIEKNIRAVEIHKAMCISTKTLSLIGKKDGPKGIQFETLEKLCKFLKVTPNEILDYSNR